MTQSLADIQLAIRPLLQLTEVSMVIRGLRLRLSPYLEPRGGIEVSTMRGVPVL